MSKEKRSVNIVVNITLLIRDSMFFIPFILEPRLLLSYHKFSFDATMSKDIFTLVELLSFAYSKMSEVHGVSRDVYHRSKMMVNDFYST